MEADATILPFCAVLIVVVPLVPAGMSLINCGFGRVRGAANAILSSLAAMAVAGLLYCLVGYSWGGSTGGHSMVFHLGGKAWNWLAMEPLSLWGFLFSSGAPALVLALQTFTAGIAALIPVSTGADRWRLRSVCFSSALLSAWIYPLFAHWVWADGWLAQLGTNFGLGHGFVDPGGAGVVQVVGGLSALAIAWTLGPRHGKYPADGNSAALPAHNVVFVLFGCVLVLPGWIALNSTGAILFAGVSLARIPLVAVNTVLSGFASFLVSILATRIRFGKPDASLCANGWIGGLVASSAISCFVAPLVAILVGLVAGLLVTISVEVFEALLTVDDPGGAVSVHAVAGLWGLLAVGMVPQIANGPGAIGFGSQANSGQLLAQVVGVSTLIGLILPMTYGLNLLLNRLDRQRVEDRAERLGMDLHELGGGAYPEFVVHVDE